MNTSAPDSRPVHFHFQKCRASDPFSHTAAPETAGRPREKNAWFRHRQPLSMPLQNHPLPKLSIRREPSNLRLPNVAQRRGTALA